VKNKAQAYKPGSVSAFAKQLSRLATADDGHLSNLGHYCQLAATYPSRYFERAILFSETYLVLLRIEIVAFHPEKQ